MYFFKFEIIINVLVSFSACFEYLCQGKCLGDYMLRPILLFRCRDGPQTLESADNRGRNMTPKVGNSVESVDESI